MIPPQAIQLVERFEGFRASPYRDQGGWSVGYGFWSAAKPQPITRRQADAKLRVELSAIQRRIVASLGGLRLRQRQLAALDDFTFNEGCGNWLNSTLRRLILAGKFNQAARQFSRWVYIGHRVVAGLVRRRKAEMRLFLCSAM